MFRKELHIFLSSLLFFTRIRLPFSVPYKETYMKDITTYLPLVGGLVGALGGGLCWGLSTLVSLPMVVAVILSMIFMLLLTGAIHEDGLADVFDGFGGGYDKNRILEIMQDSAIGTYGTMALLFSSVLRISLLSLFPVASLLLTFITVHMLSRAVVLLVTYRWEYARKEGKAKARGVVQRLAWQRMVFGLLCGVCPLFFYGSWWVFLTLPVAVAIAWLLGHYFAYKIGGYTGDCLGAVQQIVELGVLFALFVLQVQHIIG